MSILSAFRTVVQKREPPGRGLFSTPWESPPFHGGEDVNAYHLFDTGIRVTIDAAGCASSSGDHLHNAALDIAVNSFGTQSVINRANRL